MSQQAKSSGLPYPVTLIIGIVLMAGGYWVSKNIHIEFFDSLKEQGLPIDLGKTVSVIGVFLIMFPVTRMFYIQPLADAIQDRNSELERTFTEADNLRAEMTKMRNDYEQRLAATEAQAREQIQAQIKEAQSLRTNLMADASSRADEMVRKAQQEIESEKAKALTDIRIHVVDLTLAATEKLIGENLDNERNRRLIEDYIKQVEVAG